MKSTILILATLPLALAASCSSAPESPPEGTRALFNGKDLNGWVVENGGKFSVRDGVLFIDRGTGWLRSVDEFGDFVLALEFRFLNEGDNSGIFVRTGPTSKNDENGWPDNGYQVQCMDSLTGDAPIATMIPYGGGAFEHQSDLEKIKAAYRPVGEWNVYEITCTGDELEVKLNSVLVTTATGLKNRRGHIGIQAEHGQLEFRRIWIRTRESP